MSKLNNLKLVVKLAALASATPSSYKEKLEGVKTEVATQKETGAPSALASVVEGVTQVTGTVLVTAGNAMSTVGNGTSEIGVTVATRGKDKGVEIRMKAAGQTIIPPMTVETGVEVIN